MHGENLKLKANCPKERNCGSAQQVNSSAGKHDSTRPRAEQFWRTKYEWTQWKMEKQSGAPVTTCILEHICASCIYIVTRLQDLQKVELNKPSARRLPIHEVTTEPSHPQCWPDEEEKRAMMGSRIENKDNKSGREEWCTRRTTRWTASTREKEISLTD